VNKLVIGSILLGSNIFENVCYTYSQIPLIFVNNLKSSLFSIITNYYTYVLVCKYFNTNFNLVKNLEVKDQGVKLLTLFFLLCIFIY
jgi:hypothetical protein